jgi:hypothetical protein
VIDPSGLLTDARGNRVHFAKDAIHLCQDAVHLPPQRRHVPRLQILDSDTDLAVKPEADDGNKHEHERLYDTRHRQDTEKPVSGIEIHHVFTFAAVGSRRPSAAALPARDIAEGSPALVGGGPRFLDRAAHARHLADEIVEPGLDLFAEIPSALGEVEESPHTTGDCPKTCCHQYT